MPEKQTIDPNSLPIGTILQQNGKILKIIKAQGAQEHLLLEIGDFNIEIKAFSGEKFLINLDGSPIVADLSFMSSVQKFKDFIRPAHWLGSIDDLEKLNVIALEPIRRLKEPNLILCENLVGKKEIISEQHGNITLWIFDDRVVVTHLNDVKLAKPAEYPITKNKLIKINELWLYVDHSEVNKNLIPKYIQNDDYNLNKFLKNWLAQLNNPQIMFTLLGWFIATINLEQVNKLRQCPNFPFFVLTATTEAGKTALLSNCIKIFGVSYIGENFSSGTTKFVEMVECAQVSHIPIWRDEYKNDEGALAKEDWLRSVFTRADSSRGTSSQKIRRYPSNATLLLSGEDITEDSALARRMIKMTLTKDDKVDYQQHKENCLIARKFFPSVFRLLLLAKFDEEIFLDIFNNTNNFLKNDTESQDQLMTIASVGAVFGKDIAEIAIKFIQQEREQLKAPILTKSDSLEEFLEDLDSVLIEKNFYVSTYNNQPKILDYIFFPKNKPNTAYIKFYQLFDYISKNRNKNKYRWSYLTVLRMLRERYELTPPEARLINGVNTKVLIINDLETVDGALASILSQTRSCNDKWLKLTENNQFADVGNEIL